MMTILDLDPTLLIPLDDSFRKTKIPAAEEGLDKGKE